MKKASFIGQSAASCIGFISYGTLQKEFLSPRFNSFAPMKDAEIREEKLLLPVLLNYGGAEKFIADMDAAELEAARQSIMRRAREKAFSKGLPIYYRLNGDLVAEFPDGRIEPVAAR